MSEPMRDSGLGTRDSEIKCGARHGQIRVWDLLKALLLAAFRESRVPSPESRLALLLFLCSLLAACGFQLRGEVKLAANLQRVYVTSSDTYGPLKHNVEAALTRAGAKIESAPGEGIAQINMTGVGVTTVVASVGANARVNEFNMVYHVDLEISDSAGKTVLEKQAVEQMRSFTFDQTQAIGTGSEQDLIRREMERDMAQAVMRKIDVLERKFSQ